MQNLREKAAIGVQSKLDKKLVKKLTKVIFIAKRGGSVCDVNGYFNLHISTVQIPSFKFMFSFNWTVTVVVLKGRK